MTDQSPAGQPSAISVRRGRRAAFAPSTFGSRHTGDLGQIASPRARTIQQDELTKPTAAPIYRKAVLGFIDERCRGNGIERVLVTPGNHDNWDRIQSKKAWQAGLPAPLSEFVWVLPRGYRFDVGGKTFLSFGGAASLQQQLIEGSNWWPAEVASDPEFEQAGAAGFAHVMLTHEAIDGGTERVEDIIHSNSRLPLPERHEASARSRALTTALFDKVRPHILLHGHMHASGQAQLGDGRQVVSLSSDGRPGNIGVLDTEMLTWRWAFGA